MVHVRALFFIVHFRLPSDETVVLRIGEPFALGNSTVKVIFMYFALTLLVSTSTIVGFPGAFGFAAET